MDEEVTTVKREVRFSSSIFLLDLSIHWEVRLHQRFASQIDIPHL
jgi:hypothetical protein